jgi:hypothetical protein
MVPYDVRIIPKMIHEVVRVELNAVLKLRDGSSPARVWHIEPVQDHPYCLKQNVRKRLRRVVAERHVNL